jgi:sulfate transporter 3
MEPSTSSSNTIDTSNFVEISMDVHQVVPPPHMSTIQRIKNKFKETFFPDDPMRQFKGQPLNKKFILGVQYFFPILQWLPNYSFKLFKCDLIAGLTIASLAIPQVFHQFISLNYYLIN